LAAILFPVFARAREGARKSSCAQQIRQLVIAQMAYSNDYDEQLVTYCDGWHASYITPGVNNNNPYKGHCWWHLLEPYTKSMRISQFCPSTGELNQGKTRDTDYGMNCEPVFVDEIEGTAREGNIECDGNSLARNDLPTDDPDYGVPYSLAYARIETPSDFYLIMDTNDYGFDKDANSDSTCRFPGHCSCSVSDQCLVTSDSRNRTGSISRYRHMQGPNVGFADGHVKWMRYKAVISNRANFML